jgi:two-component sensor histidine kinase
VLSVELPPEPTSAGRARALARERLGVVCSPEALDTIALLVTELVTNAVLHAQTPLHLTIETTTEHVRLCVADSSLEIPEANPYEPDAVSGRGLSLVERLASAWGVDQTPSGKIVWCEIPI